MSADNMLALNAFNPSSAGQFDPVVRSLIERRSNVFGKAVPLFYEQPVNVVRAEGVWLYDHEDRPYLDAYNNVPSVGHCHPRVVEAISRQASQLNTHTRYLSEVVCAYAERLFATFPKYFTNLLFTTSGTESVDLAMRFARYFTGGTGFIVTRFAYHGHSTAVSEITPAFGPGVPLGAHVRTIPAPDSYRGDEDVSASFAASVEEAIADMSRHGIRFAGMIADSIFSSDGLFPGKPGFLRAAVDVVKRAGGVYIADEVQPGFGRTGAGMWGFQRHEIEPDLVVLGKPMGNGMPIGAVVTTPELMASFSARSGYFNTFGGNTVCCAAASAVLHVIEEENLIKHSAEVGLYLKKGFENLKKEHSTIGDVRGAGLFAGIEFIDPSHGNLPDTNEALRIVNGLRQRRILISTCGMAGNILKIRPPLPFTTEHCDQLLDGVKDLLAAR
jgi:4-aminobutyrate aminotransferase-like enzyme